MMTWNEGQVLEAEGKVKDVTPTRTHTQVYMSYVRCVLQERKVQQKHILCASMPRKNVFMYFIH